MPRKGSHKVRTGCLTCKVRKVKCDEEKPHCQRCTSTGRKCDGYVTNQPSGALWHRPRGMFPNVDDPTERRSLQFFCEAAAPLLSGCTDPYFWTHLVFQFSSFEPAVRHSVVAISSLFEQLQNSNKHTHSVDLLPNDDSRALHHYNAAIRDLKSMSNEPVVLLVCILFICIEFLRGNRDAAIEHCKHGVTILERVEKNYAWAKEFLSPIFRRLCLLPFFFGNGAVNFPKLIWLDENIPPSFANLGEAQFYVDGVLTRTVSLVRCGDLYRLGSQIGCAVPPLLLAEQEKIRSLLDEWRSAFAALAPRSSVEERDSVNVRTMWMRHGVARIWVDTTFEYDETKYDVYLEQFSSMVKSAAEVEEYRTRHGLHEPRDNPATKFTFESGFLPLLYYVTFKCRSLETRLRALSLMKSLGAKRESLWDVGTMRAVGRRIIELEHGAKVDLDGRLVGEPTFPGLPPDVSRVRDITTQPDPVEQPDTDGIVRIGRKGGFYLRKPDGEIYFLSEFIPEMN